VGRRSGKHVHLFTSETFEPVPAAEDDVLDAFLDTFDSKDCSCNGFALKGEKGWKEVEFRRN